MKAAVVLLLMLYSTSSVFADSKREIIRELIESRQAAAYEKFGDPIRVIYSDDPMMNAEADLSPRGPSITFYEGFLIELEPDALVVGICHELGHFFGHVTFEDAGLRGFSPRLKLAVEGEADYYAGRCAAEYFRSRDRATEGALRLFDVVFYSNRNSLASCEAPDFARIETKHTSRECRMLSVVNGLEGLARPTCWYNPGSGN